jgi:hypothetical protein
MLDLSKLVCNPHHGTPPDRNRVAGYRRGLASLSVVKEPFIPSPSECPGRLFYSRTRKTTVLQSPFEPGRVAATPNQLARDLSGGTYLSAFLWSGFVSTNPETRRELAFQLCVSPACAEILLRVSCFATCFGNPSRNFLPLVTRYQSLPQNKKPGVERRVQPPTPG